jgi:CDP-glycerol glycerophosphotransferase
MHIFSNSLDREKIPASAIDASKYDEMQELLCMADVFITDYSSSQWDFSLTRKPAFLFTPDLDYYLNEDRGFYTPIDDWAFPYAKSNEELANLIRYYNEELHLKKVQRHLDLLGSFEDGHATEKVCDVIIKQIS